MPRGDNKWRSGNDYETPARTLHLAVREVSVATGVELMIAIFDAAREMRLSEPALATLLPTMPPRLAVQTLLDAHRPADALGLLARLLPRRYSVGWACQCSRMEVLGEHDHVGVSLAEAWVRDPGEAQQAAALAFAKAHRFKTIGAWTAAAAGWSSGNLNPKHAQPTPPPEYLTAIAASSAVTYVAARVPSQFDARRGTFVRDAMKLLGVFDTTNRGKQ